MRIEGAQRLRSTSGALLVEGGEGIMKCHDSAEFDARLANGAQGTQTIVEFLMKVAPEIRRKGGDIGRDWETSSPERRRRAATAMGRGLGVWP